MEFLKKLFEAAENGTMSFEEFSKAVADAGIKLADLATGNYVSKGKYDDDLAKRDTTINDLNTQITQRDADLSDLQARLNSAGADNKTKVNELTAQITELQNKYDTEHTEYEAKLTQQAYEFAVREFSNSLNFTSKAAKRDFEKEMLSENLKMKNNVILGADDFVKAYTQENADAFAVVTEPENAPNPNPEAQPPKFVSPTNPTPTPGEDDAFAKAFSFIGVRPRETK